MPRTTDDKPIMAADYFAEHPGELGLGNKYNARRTWSELCRFWFDSKSEASRGEELLLLQRAGHISGLEYQPSWVLSDRKGHKVKCIADFRYTLDGKVEVEDVKGRDTAASRVKREWLYQKLGVEITVIWV